MTPREQIAAARRWVTLAVAVRVVLTALAVAAGIIFLAAAFDLAADVPRQVRSLVPLIALFGAAGAVFPVIRRARAIQSDQALALWIERHEPAEYLLVTSVEHPEVGASLTGRDFQPAVRRASFRAS